MTAPAPYQVIEDAWQCFLREGVVSNPSPSLRAAYATSIAPLIAQSHPDALADAERAERHRVGVLTGFEEVLRYVRYLMDALELRDWSVWLSEKPSDETADASVSVWYRYRGINLWISESWRDWQAEDARSTLIHEIVHVYTTPIERTFHHLEPLVGKLAWEAGKEATDLTVEQSTEGIALSLAPHLLLPQHAPVSDVPAYRYEKDGEWWWMLDYPDPRTVAVAGGS